MNKLEILVANDKNDEKNKKILIRKSKLYTIF